MQISQQLLCRGTWEFMRGTACHSCAGVSRAGAAAWPGSCLQLCAVPANAPLPHYKRPNQQTGALQASDSRFQRDMRTMETRLEGAQADVSTSRQVRAGMTHAYRTEFWPGHACSSGSPAIC